MFKVLILKLFEFEIRQISFFFLNRWLGKDETKPRKYECFCPVHPQRGFGAQKRSFRDKVGTQDGFPPSFQVHFQQCHERGRHVGIFPGGHGGTA